MTSKELLALLADRHRDDIFVPECKNGATYDTAQLRKFDAWVMARSWRNPNYIGYEIKVSRSDFVRDRKWQEYMPLCNEFSFVCPYGMIKPDELPPEVGLIWTTKLGNKLFAKRKAPRRQIETPLDVLKYVLICRASVGEESLDARQKRINYWITWLNLNESGERIGKMVTAKLAGSLKAKNRKISQLERRIAELEEQMLNEYAKV